MGRLLFYFISACILLPASFAVAQTPQKAYYIASVGDMHPGQPKFMDGIYMDGHQRKVIFRNILEVKKIPESAAPEAASPSADTRKQDVTNISKVPTVIKGPAKIADNIADSLDNEPIHEIAKKTEAADTEAIPVGEIKIEHPEMKKVPAPVIAVTDHNQSVDEVVVDMPEEKVDPLIQKYADMISLEPSDIDNYPLYRFIDKWYGTEYKWGGTDKYGIDCSAFTQKLYSEVFSMNILRTAKQQHKSCEKIKHYEDASQGDLIFFHIHRWGVSHVGVYLANGYFAHASRSRGVVISNLDNKYWRRRYASCGKIERTDGPSESDNGQ